MKSNREQIEEYFEHLHKGKTPEQIYQESLNETRRKIEEEKLKEKQESSDRISALRAIYNACNPLPSSKFRK